MKAEKSLRREKARHKKKNGMRISGASVKLLPEIMAKRAEKKKESNK